MNKSSAFGILVPLVGAALAIGPAAAESPLVVTMSNATPNNQLLVYDTAGNLVQSLATGGKGGVGGNAGGVATQGGAVAAVNFGSNNVSIFQLRNNGFQMTQLVPTASSPVSVAFSGNHLYVLGTTYVESHRMFGPVVSSGADGVVSLLSADGSAAQVGVVQNELVISEKTFQGGTAGIIETVNLDPGGAVNGVPTLVQNLPANPLAPFGLVTRGGNAYVTIAHSNQIVLVRDGKVLTVTGSGTQSSPCWLALVGPFLYSSNSPSKSVSRYAVYGRNIVQDAAVAASFAGSPTDIASGDGFVAVLDGSGHLSIFSVDEDGNLTLKAAPAITAAANGVVVVGNDD